MQIHACLLINFVSYSNAIQPVIKLCIKIIYSFKVDWILGYFFSARFRALPASLQDYGPLVAVGFVRLIASQSSKCHPRDRASRFEAFPHDFVLMNLPWWLMHASCDPAMLWKYLAANVLPSGECRTPDMAASMK